MGQRLVSPGLMGSMSISNHYQSESFSRFGFVVKWLATQRGGSRGVSQFHFCVHTGNGQFLALTSDNGHELGEIFLAQS